MTAVMPHFLCRVPHSALSARRSATRDFRPLINLQRASISWSRLWQISENELQRRSLASSTVSLYRYVLRGFSRFAYAPQPSQVTESMARSYLYHLACRRASWSYMANSICVLRAVFDRLGGMSITRKLVTPRRPSRIPYTLSRIEGIRVLHAPDTPRDRLLLGLLHLCGLKVGEVTRLRWRDVRVPHATHAETELSIPASAGGTSRLVPLPSDLSTILRQGASSCPPDDYIFQGRKAGAHLTPRAVQLIAANAGRKAGIEKPVTPMILRHSFAVNALEAGFTIRAVQETLGHRSIETTLIYQRCLPPLPDVRLIPAVPGSRFKVHPETSGFTVPRSRCAFRPPLSVAALDLSMADSRPWTTRFPAIFKSRLFPPSGGTRPL